MAERVEDAAQLRQPAHAPDRGIARRHLLVEIVQHAVPVVRADHHGLADRPTAILGDELA